MSRHPHWFCVFLLVVVMLFMVVFSSCQKEPEKIFSTTTVTTTVTSTNTVTAVPDQTVTVTMTTTAPGPTTSEPPGTTTTTTTPPTTTAVQDPYGHYHGYLLNGYPEDVWPLYESEAVASCALYIRFPERSSLGAYDNDYSVIYITEAEKEDIAAFYNSLLSEPTEPGSYYDAVGNVSGYEVDARVNERGNYNEVYLSVGLPNTPPAVENPLFDQWPVTGNPYLADWSEEQFPLYEIDDMWMEYSNVNSNSDGEIWREKEFTHSGSYEGAIEYYRQLFSGAEGYEESAEEVSYGDVEQVQLKGSKYGYEFRITLGTYGNPEVISIMIWEPL